MPFITRDFERMRKLSFIQSVKYTIKWYYYTWLMQPLTKAGFINQEEGTYIRWREFTPFFWRTLVNRTRIKLEARIASVEESLAYSEMEVRSCQRNSAIMIGGIVKAAGGEVVVPVGHLLNMDRLETFSHPTEDTIIYRIVGEDV